MTHGHRHAKQTQERFALVPGVGVPEAARYSVHMPAGTDVGCSFTAPGALSSAVVVWVCGLLYMLLVAALLIAEVR